MMTTFCKLQEMEYLKPVLLKKIQDVDTVLSQKALTSSSSFLIKPQFGSGILHFPISRDGFFSV